MKETHGGSEDGESPNNCLDRFLDDLPEDVTASILLRLGVQEILENAQNVCSSWRRICKDPSMWRFIDMKHLGEYEYLDALCREAVDRSQGQLTELYIDHFATDQLLDYISKRSSKLRCLQIRNCDGVRDDGLIEAVKRFPLLEEVNFFDVRNVRDSIEPIGHSCPKLKSFTLSSTDYVPARLVYGYDDGNTSFEALAIAKSMPGLHHLRLVGNHMTNKGLEAILDGCPNLESLDIRGCFNVDLRGEVGDRIVQKIKDFKRPSDSMEDYDWDARHFYSPSDYSWIHIGDEFDFFL